jgi:hypothetical protein
MRSYRMIAFGIVWYAPWLAFPGLVIGYAAMRKGPRY